MNQERELVLENVKEKFAGARKLCPKMSSEFYLLTDYISEVVNDNISPSGLCRIMALIVSDLKRGKDGFNSDKSLPDKIMSSVDQVIAQMAYIPQLVDVIADEEFANEFRIICNLILQIAPPKRVTGKTK